MSYSLNEIDALCRKAARGAGYDWGHAEEAGKAARWLHAHGLDGSLCLLTCLERAQDSDANLTMTGTTLRAPGPLCPLIAGACIADHAALLGGGTFTLDRVRTPILMAPYAAAIARDTGRAVRLVWPGTSLTLRADRAQFDAAQDALLIAEAPRVTCALADATATGQAPKHSRAHLSADTYDRLNALTQRTYAPATEASRAAGAGAGLTDND